MFLTSPLTPCSHLLLPYMYLPCADSAFRVNDASHVATSDEVCLATAVNARLRPECVWEVSSKTEIHYLDGEYLGACAKSFTCRGGSMYRELDVLPWLSVFLKSVEGNRR